MTIQEWLKSDLGRDIWGKKYQYKNESLDEWLDRVSGGDKELRQLILEKKFLFGGRILSNRNINKKVTYSNCYVLSPPEDSIESIFETASKLARTFSYGGGVGIDISKLAPRGARVNNSAKETTGSVSFMELYNLVTNLIGQNGRRGALMLSISCNHPDLEEFIEIKSDLNKITKANISIRVTQEFMQAVKNDSDYTLAFTRLETGEQIIKAVNARKIFRKFAEMNWDYAEPAFLFWDRIEEWNLLSNDREFKYAGVNPCAEEPLPSGGSCLLGSINLSEFVDRPFTNKANFNVDSFKNTVQIAVKGLNDVLDEGLPLHPLQEQRESVKDWRQIGLGVMGIADMLIKLGIEYGSKESIEFCDKVAFTMIDTAIKSSAKLAKNYGKFPKCNICNIMDNPFFIENTTEETKQLVREYGLRNSQLLTIAPTGSISTMLGISGGIEPIFANYYERKTQSLHGKEVSYKVYTPIVKEYIKTSNNEELPSYFITSQTLNYKERIDMQSIWQKHIDASISSTVNVPNSFTIQEVEKLYLYAWEKGLKGITIYRDGCKRGGILTTSETKKEKELGRGEWKPTAPDTVYYKRKLYTGCGRLILFIGYSEKEQAIQDLYIKRIGLGGCVNSIETTVIGMSGMLRYGGNLESITKAFNGIGVCNSFTNARKAGRRVSEGNTCGNAILLAVLDFSKEMKMNDNKDKVIKEYDIVDKTELDDIVESNLVYNSPKCPECGEPIQMSEGCMTCPKCGYSKCN